MRARTSSERLLSCVDVASIVCGHVRARFAVAVWNAHRVMPNTGPVALVIVAGVYGITFMVLSLWKGSLSWFGQTPGVLMFRKRVL